MNDMPTTVLLTLNQQQLELLDRTVARGIAPDCESLVRMALREYAAWRDADGATTIPCPSEAAQP